MADGTEEDVSSKSPQATSHVFELRADPTQFAQLTAPGDHRNGLREALTLALNIAVAIAAGTWAVYGYETAGRDTARFQLEQTRANADLARAQAFEAKAKAELARLPRFALSYQRWAKELRPKTYRLTVQHIFEGLREKPQCLDFVTRDLYLGTLAAPEGDRNAAVRRMNYPTQEGPISWKLVISERYRRQAALAWPPWCSLAKSAASRDGGGGTGIFGAGQKSVDGLEVIVNAASDDWIGLILGAGVDGAMDPGTVGHIRAIFTLQEAIK